MKEKDWIPIKDIPKNVFVKLYIPHPLAKWLDDPDEITHWVGKLTDNGQWLARDEKEIVSPNEEFPPTHFQWLAK